MRNYDLDNYIRSSLNRGGIDMNAQPPGQSKYSPATEGRFGRIWDRVRSELGNLTGAPGPGPGTWAGEANRYGAGLKNWGVGATPNAPAPIPVSSPGTTLPAGGTWAGEADRVGSALKDWGAGGRENPPGRGNWAGEAERYGANLKNWGLPGRENPPNASPPPSRDIAAMGGSGLTPDYKPQRPARPLPGEDTGAPARRTERTTGGTTDFAPSPSQPAGYKGNQRYLEMARASETDIDKQFEAMGGIEAIRGTNKTYWSPASGDEYLTKREAVAGRQGVLGPKDAAKTEQEQMDREAELRKAGIVSKTSTDTANIHGKAAIEASHIAAEKGRFHFEPATTNLEGIPNDDAVVFDTKTGISYDRNQMSPESVARVVSSALETKDPKSAVQYFMSLADATQEQAIAFLPVKQKAILLDILRSMYGK